MVKHRLHEAHLWKDDSMNRIVADGRSRLEDALLDQLIWHLTQEHAEALQHANAWQWWQLYRRIRNEAKRRLACMPRPSPDTLY